MDKPLLSARTTRRSLLAASGLGLAAAAVASQTGRAAAAEPGQYPVSATPRALVQPPDPFLGTMKPSADAATAGMFSPQVAWPLIPVHAALLPNGHLVTYGTPLDRPEQGGLVYDDWSPADGASRASHQQTPSMETYNSFCNGLQPLSDGRILMIGGNSTTATMLFDPDTSSEAMGPQLTTQRWYATILRRPDDRVLVLGGGDYYNTEAYRNPDNNAGVALTPEIGTGEGAWTQLTGAASTVAFGARRNRWWYPRVYNAPDGTVFGMSDDQMWSLSDTGTGSVRSLGTLPFTPGVSGSSAMYAPGKILVAGGGQAMNTQAVTATGAACTVDITGTTPKVATTAAMALKRNWVNLTVLGNGEVLASGGTVNGTDGGAANSSYQVEIWNPTKGTWRRGASAVRIRTYHSTALLMQSGAVFTGGGGVPGPEDNLNAELYYPPHLFTKGSDGVTRWASRVQLTSVAGSLVYGGTLTLGLSDARTIASVALVKLGNVTHSVNADQRRVPLTFSQRSQSLTVTLPKDKLALPPGSYALVAVDSAGVPSPAQTLTLRQNGQPGTVTVYPPAVAAGGGTATGTDPGVVPLASGTAVSLVPINYPGHKVRHYDFDLYLEPASTTSSPWLRADASFVTRPGLAGQGVSLESVNYPGYYLRATAGGAARVVQRDGTAAFAQAATYVAVTGLSGQGTSLRLLSDRTAYLRHRNFRLYAEKFDGSDLGRADSTFRVTSALDPMPRTAKVSLEPLAAPGTLLRHANWRLWADAINVRSGEGARADATFWVRAPLAGGPGISLETVNFPGQFVVQEQGGLVIRTPVGTTDVTAATFTSVTGAAGSGVSLRSADDSTSVVSATGNVVSFGAPGATEAARTAATFVVRPPVW
ncbi:AbfB domain-containing protein [Nocardioides flavescens]|uniref:DUF1929 domain-containing protein n=1 Tax=Nocardioides flavescens TaxID=2691959 RepID=A0A6L7ESN4_9ACTN|nr:DUF1929 domain-containing protein [Nocardioides flavescens]